jgi:predicted Na+-dependent transporter
MIFRLLAASSQRVPDALPGLALAAAALARLAPSTSAGSAVDPLLAALVLATALDIEPRRLMAVHKRWALIAALAAIPMLALALSGWALAVLAGGGATRIGLLAVGLSPTEVASVGLVGLMAGPSELAVAVLACSLVLSAVAGPPLLGLLAAGLQPIDVGSLLGRFALVVLAPLAVGLAARGLRPALGRRQDALATAATLLVVALIYVSLSGTRGGGLARPVAFSAAFVATSAAVAATAVVVARGRLHRSLVLTIAMRDFAVAAALATAAGGSRAARVAGVYGVLMLLVGAAFTGLVRRHARRRGA